MPTSYRHRRLVQEQQYLRHARRIAMDFETDGFVSSPARINHIEATELILQYTDARERVVRHAVQLMATDLATVYAFIDEMTLTYARPGSRARSKQLVLEELRDKMATDLRAQYDRWPDKTFMDDVFDEPPF